MIFPRTYGKINEHKLWTKCDWVEWLKDYIYDNYEGCYETYDDITESDYEELINDDKFFEYIAYLCLKNCEWQDLPTYFIENENCEPWVLLVWDEYKTCGMMPKDTINVPVAAYNMSLSGMQLKDYEKVLSHVDLAMLNPQMAPSAFRYKTVAHLELGDTAQWLDDCMEGAKKFPEDAYFYQSLIQYYDSRNESDKLNALADELIASDPANPFFVYLKGYIAHQKQETDAAIEWYEKTLAVDANYESALNNLSRCYLFKAQEYATAQSSTKVTDKQKLAKDKEILNGYYKKALPLLEKLREIQPEKYDLWLANLTNCYYNLNMTDKLKELEKLQESLGY